MRRGRGRGRVSLAYRWKDEGFLGKNFEFLFLSAGVASSRNEKGGGVRAISHNGNDATINYYTLACFFKVKDGIVPQDYR